MLILSCSSKLQLAASHPALTPTPSCLWQVYGTVMTINRGNPAAQEVLVDSWPEFKVILTRPRREVASDDSDLFTNTYTVYYRDLGASRALLASAGAVNWGQSFRIFGNLCPKASGRAPQQLNIYVLSGPNLGSHPTMPAPKLSAPLRLQGCSQEPCAGLDPAMRLSSLDVSHADLLNETWSFGGNEKSRKYLATLIRHFPSICLLDSAGHPVSWIASYPFGALGPGYTLHQHRRHGYMGMLNNLLAKRLHALGYPSYGYVDVENYPMQRLQEKQGFQRQPNLWYFILHNPALVKAPTLIPRPVPGTAPA
uniref:Glycine N-acyltransferase-like protein n=1 Tax=Chelonoidis abingdonii TaxID=106734 RepID=A0A8C0GVQ6_CHEAB